MNIYKEIKSIVPENIYWERKRIDIMINQLRKETSTRLTLENIQMLMNIGKIDEAKQKMRSLQEKENLESIIKQEKSPYGREDA